MPSVTSSVENSVTDASRRDFLKGSIAGALVIGISLSTGTRHALASAQSAAFTPNAFLRISEDNVITVISGTVEMGQGVLTAIPMLVAEELDADWSRIRFEQAPTAAVYNNPAFGMQATGGSTTVRAFWAPMRKAGATARHMLVAAAAQQWQVPVSSLTTANGFVVASDGRKASYGSLVALAAQQPVPTDPALKDPKDFKILGKALKRLDTPAKTNGSAKFGLDAPKLPGMVVAVMARAPLPGAKPRSVDSAKALAVKGVVQVLTIPNGIAVLATGYWAAKTGRDQLVIDWDMGEHAGLSSEKISELLEAKAQMAQTAGVVALETGDIANASGKNLEATYQAPYLAHATMEPLNCTAWLKPDSLELWTGTQGQGPLQNILSSITKVAPENIKINVFLLGGGFGRRIAPDFAIDATVLSMVSGKPVKLIFSREDDMAAGFYRPASVTRLSASLDAQGRPVKLNVGVGTPSIAVASGFIPLPPSGLDGQAMEGIADHPYDIPNQRIAYGRAEPGPQVWFWRSVGHSQNIFFMESFMDELAHAAGQDPYHYRHGLLGHQPRYKAVLEAAAEKAGWGKPLPKGVFRGIAVGQSFGSYVAEVAEVSVDAEGQPKVHRVVAAVDCGMTVNPEIIRRQIEGAIVYGLSAALYGRISYKDGRVEQGNFNDYPVLRMNAMPKVEVHILPSTEAPGGIGEPGLPPLAPALANAIYAATGKRVRQLPIDPNLLKKA